MLGLSFIKYIFLLPFFFVCFRGFGLISSFYAGLIYLFNRFYIPSLILSLNICHSVNYPKHDAGVLAGPSGAGYSGLAVSRVILDVSSSPLSPSHNVSAQRRRRPARRWVVITGEWAVEKLTWTRVIYRLLCAHMAGPSERIKKQGSVYVFLKCGYKTSFRSKLCVITTLVDLPWLLCTPQTSPPAKCMSRGLIVMQWGKIMGAGGHCTSTKVPICSPPQHNHPASSFLQVTTNSWSGAARKGAAISY